MSHLIILLSILASFNLYGALDGIQRTDWEESTEKSGQWFVEDEEKGSSPATKETDLETNLSSTEAEINSSGEEKETEGEKD
jgi:hypothetical protein